jgi:hypothetical protein
MTSMLALRITQMQTDIAIMSVSSALTTLDVSGNQSYANGWLSGAGGRCAILYA